MWRSPLGLLLLMLPWLAGCWNKVEIEEYGYVLALGVDRGDQAPYRVTVALARPSQLAGGETGGGGQEGGPLGYSSLEVDSLVSAISMLDAYTGRNVTFLHTKVLFLHEAVARDEGLQILDEMLRFRQSRRTIFFLVTREPAAEFMAGMKPQLDRNPTRYIEQLTYNVRYQALFPAESQIGVVARQLRSPIRQPLTYYAALVEQDGAGGEGGGGGAVGEREARFRAGRLPRTGGSNIELIGAAAFRQGRMIGVLSGDEMRHILMLQDDYHKVMTAFPDPANPDRFVSMELARGRPFRVDVDLSGARPRLRGVITLEANILGIQSGVDYSEPVHQDRLQRAIARELEEGIARTVRQTQDWRSDVIGLGRHIIPHFPTVEAFEAYRWHERFPEAEIRIDVRVVLRRFGLSLSPVEIDL